MHPVALVVCRNAPGFLLCHHCCRAPATSLWLTALERQVGGTRQWCQQGQNFPGEILAQPWKKRCILCIQGCCLGSHMRAGAVTFCVTRVSTCCTRILGWAGCRCRPWCWVGIVAIWLLEHDSCLGIFQISLPSVPTTLSGGAGPVLDWGPGARLVWPFLGVFASWLARAGAWESLRYFYSSLSPWYCAGGFYSGGMLHSGTYFVSFFS